jgi:hypothetical protein
MLQVLSDPSPEQEQRFVTMIPTGQEKDFPDNRWVFCGNKKMKAIARKKRPNS